MPQQPAAPDFLAAVNKLNRTYSDLGEALDEAEGDYEAARAKLLQVVAERDEAREAVEILNRRVRELMRGEPAADPSVLSLPEVPSGAVALHAAETDVRLVPSDGSPRMWMLTDGSWCGDIGAVLSNFGSVTVVMREPRTWPRLDDAPEDEPQLRGRSGTLWRYSHDNEDVPVYRAVDDLTGDDASGMYSFYVLQYLDGPLTEVIA